jgi:hypothetical protein
MKYGLEIEFEKEKHCIKCPLRNQENDGCMMQILDNYPNQLINIEFDSWESQMENCPLKEI